MSLTFLKSLLFPQTSNMKGRYRPVSQRSSPNNMERGLSQDSDRPQTHSKEKPNDTTTRTTTKPTTTTSKVSPRTIADATIGLSDGLTVPFALTAGLSTLNDTNIVIYGGLAELIAGSISMGLGGYLGARSEAAGYRAALCETRVIVAERPEQAVELVRETFGGYGFSEAAMEDVTGKLMESEEEMVGFLMRFHHRLSMDDHTASRAVKSGLTISGGYFFGGLVPLLPYLLFASLQVAFAGSVVIMILALFAFGWVKTALLAERDRVVCLRNGVQMVVMGGIAAGAAMGCVKAVGG
jgi:VIT1/CCC1 family predicted Fe2+/Mn2+ transporter